MAARKPLFMDQTEGFSEEMAESDSMTLGGLTMGGDVVMAANKITGLGAASSDGDALGYGQASANLAGLDIDTSPITMNDQKITGLGLPTASGDATNKAYVDQQVISGGSIKEPLLHEDQVDDAEGVLSSIALVMAIQPVSGDLITTDDGTTVREYGAVAGGDVQYALGASAALTMQNLVDAINADGSATCTAALSTDLDAISTTVVVITEKDNDGGVHEVYGVWATQANCDVVDFGGESDYTLKTLSDMPAASPSGTNFGMRRTQASLTDGELHYVLNNDVIYGWDDAANIWNAMSGSASIPDATSGAGGATKGKVTGDSDKAAKIVSGVLEVDIDEVTLDFSSGEIVVTGLPAQFEIGGSAVAATVDQAALDVLTGGVASDADGEHTHDGLSSSGHTHTHASTTGQGTDDHHAQAHTIASHSDTSGTGAELDTLTDGSNADSLHVHSSAIATEAPKVENTLTTATDVVAVGDPVYANGNDTVGKSLATDNAKSRVLGVIRLGAGAAPQQVEVVSCGPAVGAIAGATFGTPYYLQAAGGIGTALPSAGGRVIQVGFAVNATTLWVDIKDFAKKAA